MNRRDLLKSAVLAPLACSAQSKKPLDISEFEPKSMLQVKETKVARARHPLIDIHTHLSWATKGSKGVPLSEERRFIMEPAELLKVMDRKNIRAMVNLTGGWGSGLRSAIAKFDKAHPGRFYTFTEPMWAHTNQPGYPAKQADAITSAAKEGAKGLKVLKTLGLYLRENIDSGALIKIDDKRFDPMWEACGAAGLPVAIHISDPAAFFLPTDKYNERFEELNNHPDWAFNTSGFSEQRGAARGSQSCAGEASEDQLHRAPRRQLRGEPAACQRFARQVQEHERRDRRAYRRARPPAAYRAPVF